MMAPSKTSLWVRRWLGNMWLQASFLEPRASSGEARRNVRVCAHGAPQIAAPTRAVALVAINTILATHGGLHGYITHR